RVRLVDTGYGNGHGECHGHTGTTSIGNTDDRAHAAPPTGAAGASGARSTRARRTRRRRLRVHVPLHLRLEQPQTALPHRGRRGPRGRPPRARLPVDALTFDQYSIYSIDFMEYGDRRVHDHPLTARLPPPARSLRLGVRVPVRLDQPAAPASEPEPRD